MTDNGAIPTPFPPPSCVGIHLFDIALWCVQAKYLDWVVKDHRNILAILEDLPSLNPPIDHVLELLPRLQARLYSISSSSKVSGMTC